MTLGIVAAIGAGACFAVAGVLQQRVAATRPREESLSFRLILDLAHHRTWLIGIGVAVLSYVLQALALSSAPLSVVQPVLVSEVVFAIPISVRLHRMRLHGRERLGVLAVGAGLAVAIAIAAPQPGDPLAPAIAWVPVLAVMIGLTAAAIVVGRGAAGPARPAAYALAAALLMGLESAFMSATTHRFEHGVVAGFTAWEPYAMAVCSIGGLLLIQSAFQAGPLAVSLPITDAVAPIAAVGIGLTLFGERVTSSTPRLAGAAAGLAVMLIGIVALDTSPVVRRLHEEESAGAATPRRRPREADRVTVGSSDPRVGGRP